jgi:hypothetical protein
MIIYIVLATIIIILIIVFFKSRQIIHGTYTPFSYVKSNDVKPDNIKAYIGIIRHGTRYPTKNVFKQLTPELKNKLGVNNIGEIHPIGLQEMRDYGDYLVKTYPQIFRHPDQFKVFSTKMPRAIDSAKAAVEGMGKNNYVHINYGDSVDKFLKLKNVLKEKPDNNPPVMSCQFASALQERKPAFCNFINYSGSDAKKSQDTYFSIMRTHEKGYPFYNVLLDLIALCKKSSQGKGFLFFCHDSTLAPIYYLFGLLPSDPKQYKNSDWIPFGARMEILIDKNNQTLFYVNNRLIKIIKSNYI